MTGLQCFMFLCFFGSSYSVMAIVEMEQANTDVWTHTSDGFSWRSCNKSPVPIVLKLLDIKPHPIQLDKFFFVTAEVNLKDDIGSENIPVEVDLSLKMKIEGEYAEICDLIGEEKCHFENVCTNLKKASKDCTSTLKEKFCNCTCPFKQNSYSVENFPVHLPPPPFGIFGSFETTLVVRERGKDIGCFVLRCCIGHC